MVAKRQRQHNPSKQDEREVLPLVHQDQEHYAAKHCWTVLTYRDHAYHLEYGLIHGNGDFERAIGTIRYHRDRGGPYRIRSVHA